MTGDSTLLVVASHPDDAVDLVVGAPDKTRRELGIECLGDSSRERPGEHGQLRGAREGRFGGSAVVRVTGDATFVEDQEDIGTNLAGQRRNLGGQLAKRHGVQRAIRMIELFEAPDAQLGGGSP